MPALTEGLPRTTCTQVIVVGEGTKCRADCTCGESTELVDTWDQAVRDGYSHLVEAHDLTQCDRCGRHVREDDGASCRVSESWFCDDCHPSAGGDHGKCCE